MDNMHRKDEAPWVKVRNRVVAWFVAGIFVIVPIGVSVLVFAWLFVTIDGFLQPIVSQITGHPITGVGFGVTIVLTLLAGLLASNVLGKRLIHYAESSLARVPVFRWVYTGIKQIMEGLSAPQKNGFMQVVLVEFPKKDMMAVAFVTNESHGEPGKKLLSVFIPTSPNPTSGFLQIVREDKVIRTDVAVDEALKMIVSAGIRLPKEVIDKLTQRIPDESRAAGVEGASPACNRPGG